MKNPFALLCQPNLSRIWERDSASLVSRQASALAKLGASAAKLYFRKLLTLRVFLTLGWLVGLTAILAGCSSNSASETPTEIPTVSGDSISAEEVENYAKTVLAIEPSRQSAYNEIQQLINDEQFPDVTCTQSDTIATLPSNIRDIAVNYCNQSKQISESQGLTLSQFNTITASAQADPELQKRIQNELVRLQQ
jgi:hypothetical protein